MHKVIIGIIPLDDIEKKSFMMLSGYMNGVWARPSCFP